MLRERHRSGRDVPDITEDAAQVSVLFRGQPPNTRIAKFVSSLPADEREDTDTLLIIRYLCSRRTVQANALASVIQRSEGEAQDALRRLGGVPVDILEPTRATMNRRFPTYRLRANVVAQLGSAVTYHGRAVDDIDRKIIEHIGDYGDVNSRTIQRLFDVNVYQARDILRDLVGREVITRVSVQARGTAVRYGPGPSFPKAKIKKRISRASSNSQEDALWVDEDMPG